MNIGGQALIEGVLMRSANYVGVAVRTPQGKMKTKVYRRVHPALKYPYVFIIRGFLALWDMMIVGTKELMWSAEVAAGEKMSKQESGISLGISIIFALGLFVALPFYISKWITSTYWVFQVIEGLIRIAMFVGYLVVIRQFKDVQVMFQYHGAEHASIACHEAKKPLVPKQVKNFSTIHPRCGTAFIGIVFILAIVVFSLITSSSWLVRFAARIILIPVIAGLAYEILKLNAKYNLPVLNWLTLPGLWLQKITTMKPNERQIEVAIASLQLVLKKESK